MHDSTWWQGEIDKTIDKLAELTNGELSGVRSVEGDSDTVAFDSMESQFKVLSQHLKFCRIEKEKAVRLENEVSNDIITYVGRV